VPQSLDDILFSTNDTLAGSNEMLAGHVIGQSDSFDIDMATPLPEGALGESTIDTAMPTVVETPSDTMCRSCGVHKDWKRLA
jgi:hypothetical protein